jgi:hypothetical protein
VKRLGEAARLPAITIEAADLPEDVLALLDQHLLDLGGSWDDPNAGGPVHTMSGDSQFAPQRLQHRARVFIVLSGRFQNASLGQCRETAFVLDLGSR